MEEKERYEVMSPSLNGYAYIYDFKTDNVLNTYDSCDLLNQQDKLIKDLVNKHLLSEIEYQNYCAFKTIEPEIKGCLDREKKLEKENQQLKQQISEHNEFFNAFACKDFNEFKDFISTFMLAPHEEQTLIRELEQQLHDLPKKIVEEIRTEIEFPLYVHPDFDEFECLFDIDKLLDAILKKYGGEDE